MTRAHVGAERVGGMVILTTAAPPPPMSPRTPALRCCASLEEVRARCAGEGPALLLDDAARARVGAYVDELLAYNEHTNVYSRRAYAHLPFHVHDSLTLGLIIGEAAAAAEPPPPGARGGVLDLGSGSGLPSLLIAAVNPTMPVFALESKSRKTRFLCAAAAAVGLPNYLPLTCNAHEWARSAFVDATFVTAKAFKPVHEVVPIARACVRDRALLLVPVSEAQVLYR